jgi:hypothetical protein
LFLLLKTSIRDSFDNFTTQLIDMRLFFLWVCFLTVTRLWAQEVKTPDQFLGYPLGQKFTVHHRIVAYFHEMANAAPARMKLENYGQTEEGRELLLAVVSSPANMARMEEIRKNNLLLTGLLKGGKAETAAPAIVWLSYNVHGNEASSSEVAMKVIYELVSGKNPSVEKWLEQTVVIIDPCLNPDGRDRYVNWLTQVTGKNPVANPDAREHDEPWPGGRSNHYYFDLNRDWAWQTQIETRQRIQQYNRWMPVIHCDFHEQYPSSPYYFAPAAEPLHEVITPWQRSFQTVIGKNHARYFDANGWLYFTKEYFDLFYPAYGDSYPIYNGSIGITYEQAGHSMAGLAISVGADTLRLTDRIAHHFTTSMSTIEVAAANASQLNTAFEAYFSTAKRSGYGPYRTYLISGAQQDKLEKLKELLDLNQISYSYARNGVSGKGFHFLNAQEENFNTASGDLIVSTVQPKGALVKVLFEPQSVLSDTATYDITAWSLPYAHGLDAWAIKTDLATDPAYTIPKPLPVSTNDYAYLVKYQSFKDAVFLAALLQEGIRVRFAEKDFLAEGKPYPKGSLIVLRNGNQGKIEKLVQIAAQQQVQLYSIHSGFMESGFDLGSDKIHEMRKPVVALVSENTATSTAVGEVWHYFEKQLNYPLIILNEANLESASLKKIDILIFTDGYHKVLTEKEGFLKAWVKQGGKIIALEAALNDMATGDWGLHTKKDDAAKEEEKKDSDITVKKYGDRERQGISNNIPGAIYKVDLDDSHPLAFGYGNHYFTLKMNSILLDFFKDGWNVGSIKNKNRVAGFVGSQVSTKIKDGTVIGVQNMGRGTVIYFADNPLFRSFWEGGKLIFANAIFLSN